MTNIDITFNDEIDFLTDANWQTWIEQLLDLAYTRISKTNKLEMSINFVSNDEIKKINREYRDKDRVTDVISFAIEDGGFDIDMSDFLDDPDFVEDIGDLFIAPKVVEEHGKEYGHGFKREFGYTLVHGFLHLNGYDHIDPGEEKEMIGLQNQILDEYGLER